MKLNSSSGKHSGKPAAPSRGVPPRAAQTEPVASPLPQKKTGKARKRRTMRIIAIVVCSILLISLLAVLIFELWATAPEISVDEHPADATEKPGDVLPVVATSAPDPAFTPAPDATPEPEPTPDSGPHTGRREGVYTVLVVGQDVAGMNTDTIMLASFDTVAHKLNVVSIPRDTLVNVTWSVKKVNSYYGSTGTEDGLIDGISELTGFKADSYVVVNIYAFEQIVDAIGGVDFDVPVNMEWGDPTIGKYYSISAGYQHLDGYNALGVVRFRHNTDGSGYPNGDIGRVNTQQAFAKTLAAQMLSIGNIPNLGKVIDIITANTKTNLTSGNLAFYAQEFLKLNGDDISFSTLPYDPVYIKGGSYVAVQLYPWLDLLNEKLNPFYEPIEESDLDILTIINDSFYSTTGILAGGYDSFYDYTAITG